MLFKRTIGTLAAFLVAGATVLATSAAACVPAPPTEGTCTPSDAWDQTIPAVTHVVHHDAITHTETVIDTPAVDRWYSWTGGQSDTHPWPSENWQVDNGQHQGFPQDAGVYERPKGNSDNAAWFYHEVVAQVSHQVVVVDKEAWDETVVDTPATVIHHDAVTCPPPLPAAQPCVATGSWYTEDVAPVVTPQGLYFQGQHQAVNWLHPTSGNIQGFTGATYTLADVSGYQTAYRFVVNPNKGTLHYASVTVEPYMNGWVAGQSGTFTITPASHAWSSKIASGPGSQSQPVPLSQFATIWPDNALLSQGFHLGSANPPTTYSTVTGVTGCLTGAFGTAKPAALTGVDKTDSTPVCVEPKDGTATVTHTETSWTQAWTWDAEQSKYVLGEKVYGEPVVTTVTVADEGCIPTAPTYEPTVETTFTAWVDGTFKCGDTTVAQTRTKTVTTTTFHAVWGDGGYAKVADKPTVVTSTETQDRTLTAADLATLTCSTPTPTPSVTPSVTPSPTASTTAVVGTVATATPKTLAYTGVDWLPQALLGGALLLLGVGAMVLSARKRHATK